MLKNEHFLSEPEELLQSTNNSKFALCTAYVRVV